MRASIRKGVGGHVQDGHDMSLASGLVSLERQMRGGKRSESGKRRIGWR